ncbi:hypothetical protein HPC49_43230 [Pyxidicoccus fallax]|uniref:DAC domain-containing protein n=1 Tax=Pyxidicoccus fallax TaxID=394095 RepID=A0A848LZ62_9BACT|nr:diadenylate cyclase [Pyxidicoccus fallax]NMO22822.1 hypothetical protein [Pyxidicoccus fallax]NPC85018.1 hypothetical protein [Pyxidicoccus fallax]
MSLHDVVEEMARAHDLEAGTYSLASEGARVSSYDVVFLLEFTEIAAASRDGVMMLGPKGETVVGLIKAASHVLLDRLASEARKEDAGFRLGIKNGEIEQILMAAGETLIDDLQFYTRNDLGWNRRLFDSLNVISSLRYESAEARATVVVGVDEPVGGFLMKFRNPVPLSNSVWARKTVQMAAGDCCVYSDGASMLGMVRRVEHRRDEFWIRLKGQGKWEAGTGALPVVDVRFGLPSRPIRRLEKKRFEATFSRVFTNPTRNGIDQIWALLEGVFAQGHGALIVVDEAASSEAGRLASQATPIEPVALSADVAARATAIDGAILLDPDGVCHGVGVILDGESYLLGTASRGARFNSALRYVQARKGIGRLAVVVSEDGQVDLIPRLRPQINLDELTRLVFLASEPPLDDVETPEYRRACEVLVRYHGEYLGFLLSELRKDLDEEGRGKAIVRMFSASSVVDEPGFGSETFDPHRSDFPHASSEDVGPADGGDNT